MRGAAVNRVLFISGIDGDTRRYRCVHQQEQLALKGIVTALREDDDPQLLTDVFDYDLFVLHRVPFSPVISLVIDIAHAQGKPVVFETDDLIFAPELEGHIGFLDTLTPETACRFRSDLKQLEKTFQCCDCVLTTTEFLAQEARRRGKPAYVNRNVPNSEMFHLSEQAWAERQRRLNQEDATHPVVIAYFSGTGSHNRDFQTIAEPLAWILSTYPQTWLHIGGQLNLGPAFEPFWDRIRRTPYVTWRELPQLIAQADINLSPLELDNPFCQAKSEIKFTEAALVGVPTIASRVEAYEQAITHGQDGFLATTPDEWRDALQTLLDHPDQRRDIGEVARRSVYARYTPELRAEELWSILNNIWRQFGGLSVDADGFRHALVACVEQYADEMQRQARQQGEQIESLRQMVRYYETQLIAAGQRNVSLLEQITLLEQHLEAIRQGRVMRLMTAVQRRWQQIIGRADSQAQ
jgi:glycosyltransferase involved in cell wall biosynthesis